MQVPFPMAMLLFTVKILQAKYERLEAWGKEVSEKNCASVTFTDGGGGSGLGADKPSYDSNKDCHYPIRGNQGRWILTKKIACCFVFKLLFNLHFP